MAQPLGSKPVPNPKPVPQQIAPASGPTESGTDAKIKSGDPREGSGGLQSNQAQPEPFQTTDPQWRTDSHEGVDEDDELVLPHPDEYSTMIRNAANTQDKFLVTAYHGMEGILIDNLVGGTRWQEVKITVVQDRVLPDLLISLQEALSKAGQQKKVCLHIKMDTLSKAFTLPSSQALQLSGLHIDMLMDQPGLEKLLEPENACLTEVIWSSADECDPQVESLLKGSHQLQTLELSALPDDVDSLLDMLELKPKLEALSLGRGKYSHAGNGKLLEQILGHAPGLKRLTLTRPKFDDSSFEGCHAAFKKSALLEFNVYEPKLKSELAEANCGELLKGVSQAPNLASLGLQTYGESELDEALLKAFANNPAARTVKVLGHRYPADLDNLLIGINKARADRKWEPIILQCPTGAVSYAPAFQLDSESNED